MVMEAIKKRSPVLNGQYLLRQTNKPIVYLVQTLPAVHQTFFSPPFSDDSMRNAAALMQRKIAWRCCCG